VGPNSPGLTLRFTTGRAALLDASAFGSGVNNPYLANILVHEAIHIGEFLPDLESLMPGRLSSSHCDVYALAEWATGIRLRHSDCAIYH
jgi:hypothetical protein